MNFEFNIGGNISFSADMGYRPAPAGDNRPANALVINDLASNFIIGSAEVIPEV